jgi:hypothetical protein
MHQNRLDDRSYKSQRAAGPNEIIELKRPFAARGV